MLTRSTHSDNLGEPFTWVRTQGEGRVFYTAWGHDSRAFTNPGFHDLIERGIRYAAGQDVPQVLAEREIYNPFEYRSAARSRHTAGKVLPNEMQLPLSPEDSMRRIVVSRRLPTRAVRGGSVHRQAHRHQLGRKGPTWILETSDYPNRVTRGALGQGNDRLVILEDTDGDGLADKRTVFADGLNIPTGFVFANGGVIVQMAPYTLFLKDTDGDDRADVVEILMDGWSQGDTHAGASNLLYGLDNHIWGVVGYSGRPGLNQSVWRMPLDASSPADIEQIAVTTNNTWGLGLSEEGLVFVSTANNNPSGYVAIPRRYFNDVPNFNQPMTPNISGSPIMLPSTEPLPSGRLDPRLYGRGRTQLVHRSGVPAGVLEPNRFRQRADRRFDRSFILQRDGADVTSYNPSNLLSSDDEWMSPIVAKVGPDGAVWILDFYNFIIQHNPTPPGYTTGAGNAYETELRDNEYGRIYRVSGKTLRRTNRVT